jgi:hypothetical protein
MAAKMTLNRLLRIASNIVVKIIPEDSGLYRRLAFLGLALSSNYCIRLRNGNLYTCGTIPCAEHFNTYFGEKLAEKAGDYIEVDKISNLDELLDFLCVPKQFCRYCKRKDVSPGQQWAVSKRQIEEWV